MGDGFGSGIGAGLHAGKLGQGLLRHGHKKMQRKGSGAVRKRNSGNSGKLVRNWYEIRTHFVPISQSRESVA